jgi:release factor glutamine methyltransferase
LAISLKLERPSLSITATDISAPALKVAQWNAATLGAEVEFQEVDLNPVLTDPIHSVIVANLPYVPSADAAAPELGHEPVRALDGGTDGFAVIARLLDRLAPAMPRLLFLEIDPSHAPRLLKRFSGQCEIIPDLAGRERFAIISR